MRSTRPLLSRLFTFFLVISLLSTSCLFAAVRPSVVWAGEPTQAQIGLRGERADEENASPEGRPDMAAPAVAAIPSFATTVGGDITQSTTWTLAGSPYHVTSSVWVRSAVTLTVEAGVRVLFDRDTKLTVYGTLRAIGTEAQPITFTSTAATPAPRDWLGIHFYTGGSDTRSIIEYATIRYADPGLEVWQTSPTIRHVDSQHNSGYGAHVIRATLTLEQCTFSQNGAQGIHIQGGAVTLDRCTIEGNASEGVGQFEGGSLDIRDSTLRENGGDGLVVWASGTIPPTLTGNRIENNRGHAVVMRYDGGAGLPTMSGNTIAGNSGIDGVGLAGTLGRSMTWPVDYPVPLAIVETLQLTRDYPGVELEVLPGTTVRLSTGGSIAVHSGALRAIGTPMQPITFTGSGGTGTSEPWNGVLFGPGSDDARCILEYVEISYAWKGLAISEASPTIRHVTTRNNVTDGVELDHCTTRLEQCTVIENRYGVLVHESSAILDRCAIEDNAAHGILVEGNAELSVARSSISGNQSGGIQNYSTTAIVDAVGNWWGSSSGPYHRTTNPNGQGDQVSDRVVFDPWAITPPASSRPAIPLTLDQSKTGSVRSLAYDDYVYSSSGNQSLLVEVTPSNPSDVLWVYSRFGGSPEASNYDLSTQQKSPRGKYELALAPTRHGEYYLSVYGRQVSGDGADYGIVVRQVERYLSDIEPRTAGNRGRVSFTLRGLGFVEGMGVELRRQGQATLAAKTVTRFSAAELSAAFELSGAQAGAYDVAAIWPGGQSEARQGALQITAGQGEPKLKAWLEAPQIVRPGRVYMIQVHYANKGDVDLPAPLLSIENVSGAPLRLAEEDPYEDRPIQVLGINPKGDAAWLPAGASHHVPVYFQVSPNTAAHTRLRFEVSALISETTPIDWAQIEADARPAEVDPDLWRVFWPSFKSQIGNTWGDYRRALAEDASYLSTLGRRIYNAQDLLQVRVQKALGMAPRSALAGALDAYAPAPGLPLQLARVFPGSLEGRFDLGPLGRGWSHSYDISAQKLDTGEVRIRWPGAESRLFRRNSEGAYVGLPGDYGELSPLGAGWTLREKDGAVYTFGADGRLASIRDRRSNTISASYDGAGRLSEVRHSSGDRFTLQYNAQGRLARLVDQADRATTYGYDASGEHLLSVTAPGGRATTYAYQAPTGQATDHALLSVTYPDNTHQYYAYDSLGRLSQEQRDGGAGRVSYSYDALYRIHATDASGATQVVSLDEFGRVTRVQDALGNEASSTYDRKDNLTEVVDPAGQVYEFEYGALGNLTQSENPLGQKVMMTYEGRTSRMTSLEDARGSQTRFVYDNQGNLTAMVYADDSRERVAYDAAGNPIRRTLRSGDVISYTYNVRGQVLRADYPDGSWKAYEYDAAGNMTRAADPSGAIQMTYDGQTNNLTRISYPSGQWLEFRYNAAGRRTQRRDQDGRELNYDYDAAGRLARLTDEGGREIVSYQYDTVGRLSGEAKGNGTYTVYTYDAAGNVLSVANYAEDGGVQSRFNYAYDSRGNPISMSTLAGVTRYEYDALSQLVGVSYPDGRRVAYAYDEAGNRSAVGDDGAETAYAANALNQYIQVGGDSYTYDANGNMTSRRDGSGVTTYAYDYDNRLVRVTAPGGESWEYQYDALGNRASVTHGGAVRRYVHDPAGLGDVAAEYDGSGALAARYVQGLGLAARIDGAGSAAYYAYDATGHTRQVTNSAGAVANRYDYDPFGIPMQADETIPNPFRYVGRFGVMEDGNGLGFMRARYYDARLGRFTTEDPLKLGGGDTNLYTYGANSPLVNIDPSGHYMLWLIRVQNYLYAAYPTINLAIRDMLGQLPWMPPSVPQTWAGLLMAGMMNPQAWLDALWYPFWAVNELGWMILFVTYDLEKLLYDALFPDVTWNCPWEYGTSDHAFSIMLDSGLTVVVDWCTIEVVTPDDPNEKAGPPGLGARRLMGADEELQYVVYFENQPSASAPAQEVFVTDDLDPDLDWSTFRPLEIAWGDQVIAASGEGGALATRQMAADHRPEVTKTWWVDVCAEIDYGSGRTLWTLRTLDPETGGLPEDALAGFLPPNDATHRGEGHIVFAVRPKAELADGALLSNQARIKFDTNEIIATNVVTNTIGTLEPRLRLPVLMRNAARAAALAGAP